jgi:microcystin-dependent protein
MGTTFSSSIGQSGGANSYSLTTNQLPSHLHSFTTSNAGNHSHNITINSAGSHSHTTYNDDWGIWYAIDPNGGLSSSPNNPERRFYPANAISPGNSSTGTNGSHTHTASSNNTGSHSHSGTTSAIGSGSSIDNRPAFVKLAYIIKL